MFSSQSYREEAFSLSRLGMMLAEGVGAGFFALPYFALNAFYLVEEDPFYSQTENVYHECVLNFMKCLFCTFSERNEFLLFD